MKKEKTIRTLDDYLEMFGASTPYEAGRRLYEDTACGPWTAFVVNDAPETSWVERGSIVRGADDCARIAPKTVGGEADNIGQESRKFLQFAPDDEKIAWPAYVKMVRGYLRRKKKTGAGIHGSALRDCVARIREGRVDVELFYRADATTKSIGYEDDEARGALSACVGIEVGSIVEGSDVYVGPEYMAFPFTEAQFDEMVKRIDDEAAFYWKRDNAARFFINKNGKTVASVSWTEFDDNPTWSGQKNVPLSVRRKWVRWYTKGRFEERWPAPEKVEDAQEFGAKGWTCVEFYDDSTY
jgi:hypothetical protein